MLGFGCSIAGMFLSFFYAVELIPMAIGSTIEFMGPLALSVLFARRASHFLYIFLAMAGVLALAPELGTSLNRLGVVYAVLSAVFWAVFVLLSPKISKAFEGESGLAIGMAIACALIFPFAWLDNGLGSVAPSILLGEFLMAFFLQYCRCPWSITRCAAYRRVHSAFLYRWSLPPRPWLLLWF